jgi:hypothetical protein
MKLSVMGTKGSQRRDVALAVAGLLGSAALAVAVGGTALATSPHRELETRHVVASVHDVEPGALAAGAPRRQS